MNFEAITIFCFWFGMLYYVFKMVYSADEGATITRFDIILMVIGWPVTLILSLIILLGMTIMLIVNRIKKYNPIKKAIKWLSTEVL